MTALFHRFTAFVVLCCFLSAACSGVQAPAPPQLGPRSYEADVVAVAIDHDAYAVRSVATLSDVQIRMLVTDAGVGPNGERIAPLRQNQPAPFAGVLFNGPALAYVEVEYRGLAAQCGIDYQADMARLSARALADIQHLQASLQTQRLVYQLMLRGRDADIDQLNDYIRRYPSGTSNSLLQNLLLFGGGILVGAAILGVTAIILQTTRP